MNYGIVHRQRDALRRVAILQYYVIIMTGVWFPILISCYLDCVLLSTIDKSS